MQTVNIYEMGQSLQKLRANFCSYYLTIKQSYWETILDLTQRVQCLSPQTKSPTE